MEEQKLAIDVFLKASSKDLQQFKHAVAHGKKIMLRDIHLDERFAPQKYVIYYLTFRILKLPERKPIPEFNIFQQKIERLHNAAIILEMLELKLNKLLEETDDLFYYFEVGGVFILDNETPSSEPWFEL